jgi:hypothetical protein
MCVSPVVKFEELRCPGMHGAGNAPYDASHAPPGLGAVERLGGRKQLAQDPFPPSRAANFNI